MSHLEKKTGNALPQTFQFGEPLWTDSDLKSCNGVRNVIFTLLKKKKNQVGNRSSNLPSKVLTREVKAINKRHNNRDLNCQWTLLPGVRVNTRNINSTKSASLSAGDSGLSVDVVISCLLYTSPSPRDINSSRMPSSA